MLSFKEERHFKVFGFSHHFSNGAIETPAEEGNPAAAHKVRKVSGSYNPAVVKT